MWNEAGEYVAILGNPIGKKQLRKKLKKKAAFHFIFNNN